MRPFVRGVVGRESQVESPRVLLNKILSDVRRVALTFTVNFLTDCFGRSWEELNEDSVSSSSPINNDRFGDFTWGFKTERDGFVVTLKK